MQFLLQSRENFINSLIKQKWKLSVFVHVSDLFPRLLLGRRERVGLLSDFDVHALI